MFISNHHPMACMSMTSQMMIFFSLNMNILACFSLSLFENFFFIDSSFRLFIVYSYYLYFSFLCSSYLFFFALFCSFVLSHFSTFRCYLFVVHMTDILLEYKQKNTNIINNGFIFSRKETVFIQKKIIITNPIVHHLNQYITVITRMIHFSHLLMTDVYWMICVMHSRQNSLRNSLNP